MCARCAEQRGPDLGGKAEKNWTGLPTLVRSKTRTGVLKTNWIGSPDRDFPVQADPILICIFLLISAADPIQISDRDIPNYNTESLLSRVSIIGEQREHVPDFSERGPPCYEPVLNVLLDGEGVGCAGRLKSRIQT